MMDKVFFKINNHLLYLDYMLEEYDYIPMMYVCIDEEQERYLVLCSDFEKESYLISKITLTDLNDMLLGKIDMRSAFLSQTKFWSVQCVGTDYMDDIVEEQYISSYPKEYLPKIGEIYVLYDEEHKEYQRRISKVLRDTIDGIEVKEVNLSFEEGINVDSVKIEFFETSQEVDLKNYEKHLIFASNEIGLYAA